MREQPLTIPHRRRVVSVTTYANLPATGLTSGDLGYTEDTQIIYRWDGSAWNQITFPALFVELLGTENHTPTVVGGWEDWDISAIVPAGTKYVLVKISEHTGAGALGGARKNGSALGRTVWAVGAAAETTIICECDTNRVIEVYNNAANPQETGYGILGYWQGVTSVNPLDLPTQLANGKLLFIPTNGSWTETKVAGGGSSVTQAPTYLQVNTSVTANSSDLLYAYTIGIGTGKSNTRIDWAKKVYLFFTVFRGASDAQAVARIQLKGAITIGALGSKGIGLQIDNLTLTGESYGTALGTQALGLALTQNLEYGVMIICDPATPKVEYYVDIGDGNGMVLLATESGDATKVPAAVSASDSAMVVSINNGAGGGTNCILGVGNIRIWQGR